MFTEQKNLDPLQPNEFKVCSQIVHPEIRLNKTKIDPCLFAKKSTFLHRNNELTE